jgi:hypothetical protein
MYLECFFLLLFSSSFYLSSFLNSSPSLKGTSSRNAARKEFVIDDGCNLQKLKSYALKEAWQTHERNKLDSHCGLVL